MYAPRRYGKTSLVRKDFARLEDEGIPTLSIDLNKIANIEKFCDAGIAALMSENTDYYVEKLSTLSSMQRLLVAALAEEPVREFTEDYRVRHSLGGSSTVHTALKAVIERGVVESEPDGYFIGDPFFARYVRT